MKKIACTLLILLSVSCSGVTDFQSGMVEGYVSKNTLHIGNISDQPLWIFIVERETAATINWARNNSDENRINPDDTKKVPLQEVFGYEKGDELLLYYWTSTDPGDELYSIVIDTD